MIVRGKYNGAKSDTEAMDSCRKAAMVGERCVIGEGIPKGVLEVTEVRMQA